MKKFLFLALWVVVSSSFITSAALAKPSPAQIKKLIKKMVIKEKVNIFVGLTYLGGKESKCEDVKIKRIKLLKIGKSTSNYYESSGNYIGSDFMVKFTIQGSCNLTPAFRINSSDYDDYTRALRRYNRVFDSTLRHYGKKPETVIPMDLSGRVPFRSNIPFEVSFSTDSYGDWYASKYPRAFNRDEDRFFSDKTQKYLKNLFYKINGPALKKKEQETNQARMKKQKRIDGERKYLQEKQQKLSDLRSRLASVKKQMVTQEDFRNYQSLENICKKNKWRSCYGSIPHCYVLKGVKRCPAGLVSLSSFENFYVPLVRAQKKYRGKIVKKIAYEYRGGSRSNSDIKKFTTVFNRLLAQHPKIQKMYNSKGRSYKNKFFDYLYYQKTAESRRIVLQEFGKQQLGRASIATAPKKSASQTQARKLSRAEANELIADVKDFLRKNPKTHLLFNSLSIAKQEQLIDRITKGTNRKQRQQIFLQISKELKRNSRSSHSSSSHSHAGRAHSHKLPPQGKAHRHRGGTMGR